MSNTTASVWLITVLTAPGADVGATIWTTVETSVGILCACMPVLRPICYQSRRRGTPTPAATGHTAWPRFPRIRDLESERQWTHALQTLTTSSEVDMGSDSPTKPDGAQDIRKTVQIDVIYGNAL